MQWLLLLSAFTSHMSSAIQWQHHQLSAIAAAHPPAWSVGSCWQYVTSFGVCHKGTYRLLQGPTSFDRMHSGLGWSGTGRDSEVHNWLTDSYTMQQWWHKLSPKADSQHTLHNECHKIKWNILVRTKRTLTINNKHDMQKIFTRTEKHLTTEDDEWFRKIPFSPGKHQFNTADRLTTTTTTV